MTDNPEPTYRCFICANLCHSLIDYHGIIVGVCYYHHHVLKPI
ncbi:hypothetical protein QDX21_07200 [Auritidibacter ignavus]|uniref:Uncharacterized protein n=1 Tax=Auritidibacter ignavus TaxID=678932 RepID=A0AAJ6AG67_9MICC|nr:hypothetical protein [Auritidibacter ignavus]WGH92122.1 hypothetical protein QDX21_07200 [Auritidibacter ignavus]